MYILNVNGRDYTIEAQPDELLVWVLLEKIGLTKTRFGCGIEMCGACLVLMDGEPARSCTIAVAQAVGKKIRTKEVLPDGYEFR